MTNTQIQRFFLFTTVCLMLAACDKQGPELATGKVDTEWWISVEPDVIIGDDEFYAGECSITQVNTTTEKSKLIFKRSTHALKSCRNRNDALSYDGEYLILSVCEMKFATGGCNGYGRYRSADMENWEEEIGVTWIQGEEYEAWRRVGSTSNKADSVKKVVRND